jgi:hypothetical protein
MGELFAEGKTGEVRSEAEAATEQGATCHLADCGFIPAVKPIFAGFLRKQL